VCVRRTCVCVCVCVCSCGCPMPVSLFEKMRRHRQREPSRCFGGERRAFRARPDRAHTPAGAHAHMLVVIVASLVFVTLGASAGYVVGILWLIERADRIAMQDFALDSL
jgi:L-lactate utilization protein LutB